MKRFFMAVFAVMTGHFLYDLVPLMVEKIARLSFDGWVYKGLILFGAAMFFMGMGAYMREQR